MNGSGRHGARFDTRGRGALMGVAMITGLLIQLSYWLLMTFPALGSAG